MRDVADLITDRHIDTAVTDHRLRWVRPKTIRRRVLSLVVKVGFLRAPPLVDAERLAVVCVSENTRASRERPAVLATATVFWSATAAVWTLVALGWPLAGWLLAILAVVITLLSVAVALYAGLFVSDWSLRSWEKQARQRLRATLVASNFASHREVKHAGEELAKQLATAPALAGNRIWITVDITKAEAKADSEFVLLFKGLHFRERDRYRGKKFTAIGMLRDDRLSEPSAPKYEPAFGDAVLDRLIRPRHTHRRVDKFLLSQPGRVRHVTSLDVEVLPALCRPRSNDRSELVVPLMFITKRAVEADMFMVRSLDLRDDTGRSLPMLGRFATSRALYFALRRAMEQLTDDWVDDESCRLLWDIVRLPSVDAEEELGKVSPPTDAPDSRHEPTTPRAIDIAAENPVFQLLLRFAAASYLLCVSIQPGDMNIPSRRVFKISREYSQVSTTAAAPSPWKRLRRFFRRLASRFGLRSVVVSYPVQGVLPSRSQHVEVEHGGELVDLSAASGPPLSDNHLTPSVAHLHLGARGLRDQPRVLGSFAMSLQQSLAALLSLVVLAALLTAFASMRPDPQSEAAVTLLLLFPGAVSGVAAASRRDPYAADLLRPLRVVISCGTLAAIAGAATVLLASGSAQTWILAGLAGASGTLFLWLLWASVAVRWGLRLSLNRRRNPGTRVLRSGLWERAEETDARPGPGSPRKR